MPGSTAWLNRLSPFITDIWWRWPLTLTDSTTPFKVEVKYDKKSKETGNVCLEHTSLLNTSSDFVVFVLAPEVCLLSRKTVQQLITEYPVVRGGDQNHKLTLVPKDKFLKQSTLI